MRLFEQSSESDGSAATAAREVTNTNRRDGRFVRVIGLLMLAATILSTGVAWGQEDVQEPASGGETFTLQVGDVIAISVWKENDLGATVPIRPDGNITLPLIGDISVLGLTPEETRSLIASKFMDFVAAPAVSVVVTEINSWNVYILGEVGAAGVYSILRPTRLLQALAMAGGFTEYAKKDEVVLLRNQGPVEERRVINVKGITSGRSLGDNLLLKPGDTILVP